MARSMCVCARVCETGAKGGSQGSSVGVEQL